MKGDVELINFLLQPLFQDIRKLQSSCIHIIVTHVYMENNGEAYNISKGGLKLKKETFGIKESQFIAK